MTPSSAPHLSAGMPAGAALAILAGPLLDEAAHCAECAIDDDDPELIHRFRVSLRKLRSLLWAYVPLLPATAAENAETWRSRLGELAGITGAAREWAVTVEELAPAFLPAEPVARQQLLTAFDQRAHETAIQCRSALLEAAPATILSLLRQDIAEWSGMLGPSPSLGKFARQRLRDADRILRQRGKRTMRAAARYDPDSRALHRTRIAIKRVHYLTALFASAIATRHARRVKSLKRLQLHLGLANDAAVAMALLHQLPAGLCGRRLRRQLRARLSMHRTRCEAKAYRALATTRKRFNR